MELAKGMVIKKNNGTGNRYEVLRVNGSHTCLDCVEFVAEEDVDNGLRCVTKEMSPTISTRFAEANFIEA